MSIVNPNVPIVEKIVVSKPPVDNKNASKSIKKLLCEYNKSVKENAKNIENVKLHTKELLDNLDKIELSSIKNILAKHNVLTNNEDPKVELEEMKCTFCNSYSTKNKACFGQHNRRCKSIPKNIKSN